MNQNLEFKMSDGLIIRGQLEGNMDSNNLVVMLHSGGYDRHERGVQKVTKDENGNRTITYYNPGGNYDYLTNLLNHDYCILRIDQRNHGQSGKNIDKEKLAKILTELNVEENDINAIIQAELSRDKKQINEFAGKYPNISNIIKRPPLKDMSFIRMKDDLKEVMDLLPEKAGKEFKTVDYVGTCMGGLILGLYLIEHPEKANSLTLFSPLFTFDYSFINPPKEAELQYKKKQTVESGKQFRMGNAVEGISTYREIEKISKDYINNLANLNIPIFCIQGLDDVLVPAKVQNKLFENLEEYRKENNINETYYGEIQGVHCLYDSIYPSVLEVSNFIEGSKPLSKQL